MAENRRLIEPLIVRQHPFRRVILNCYRENLRQIISLGTAFANGNSTYNFELFDHQPVSLRDLTNNIYHNQRHAFRINAACGIILFHNRKNTARYWYPCWSNAGLFDNTPYVYNRTQWDSVADRLSSTEHITSAGMQVPDTTEESVVWVTNLHVWVWLIHAHVLM